MAERKQKKPEAGAEAQSSVQTVVPVVSGADFSFAVNPVKLNRALAHVRATQPGLKGEALADAVKERYVEIKGLLREDAPEAAAAKKRGKVENMADDDGSDDDE